MHACSAVLACCAGRTPRSSQSRSQRQKMVSRWWPLGHLRGCPGKLLYLAPSALFILVFVGPKLSPGSLLIACPQNFSPFLQPMWSLCPNKAEGGACVCRCHFSVKLAFSVFSQFQVHGPRQALSHNLSCALLFTKPSTVSQLVVEAVGAAPRCPGSAGRWFPWLGRPRSLQQTPRQPAVFQSERQNQQSC